MIATRTPWLAVGILAVMLPAHLLSSQRAMQTTSIRSVDNAACPKLHHIQTLEHQGTLADSQAALAQRMAAQGDPTVDDLVDLACMRAYLFEKAPPADSVTYLTLPHSSWSYASLRAALLARSIAPGALLPLRTLAFVAVHRAGLRKTRPSRGPEWSNHIDDLPSEGPAPDLSPVLTELFDWVEAGHQDWMVRRGCMALALDLAVLAQAHRCGVRVIADEVQPEWQLLRLAWLALYAASDSATARAMVTFVLDHTTPGPDPDLGVFACSFVGPMHKLPEVDSVLSVLAVMVPKFKGWSMQDWQYLGKGCDKFSHDRSSSDWPFKRDLHRDMTRSSGVGVLASGWHVTDPLTGASMLVIAARLRDREVTPELGQSVIGSLLQWWRTEVGGRLREDSIVIPRDSTVVVTLPSENSATGFGGWDLAVLQGPMKGAGTWDDRVAPTSAPLQLSDLILGGSQLDGLVVLGVDSVRAAPEPAFREHTKLQLAFQIRARAASDSSTVQLNVHGTDKHTARGLRLAFPVRLTAGEQLLKYAIDLASLKAGEYEIIATVIDRGSGATVSRSSRFTVEH